VGIKEIAQFILAVSLVATAGSANADELASPCKGNPEIASKIVGKCFMVRGRANYANGIPFRLWIVGTHRIVAPTNIPPKVADYLDLGVPAFDVVVFGDYEICPIEKDIPGWMRSVCIESATHLKATKWDGKPVRLPQ